VDILKATNGEVARRRKMRTHSLHVVDPHLKYNCAVFPQADIPMVTDGDIAPPNDNVMERLALCLGLQINLHDFGVLHRRIFSW